MAQRNPSIDRIRVVLTVLVIFHHTAITYGAIGGWYFKEPRVVSVSSVLLTMFCTINQSFFMGFFFLLAGYFTPSSLERKGTRDFILDRLMRLGLPLLVYGFLIGPATEALAATASGEPFFANWLARIARGEFENGPLWFAQALLMFTALYFVARFVVGPFVSSRSRNQDGSRELGAPAHRFLAVGVIVVGMVAFSIRLLIPVGKNVFGLQWAYFASYVFLFGLGCAASRAKLLEKATPEFARPWTYVSALTLPLLFVYAILAGVLRGAPFDSSGGFTLPALFYSLWEPLVAWGIILAFLAHIHRVASMVDRALARMMPLAYGAYIVHPPILVGTALVIHDWSAAPLAKFAFAGVVSVAASFATAVAIRRLPGAAKVI